ncbi:MAG: hypothetical protein WB779_08580 [Ignavibacteriaceae bacterium]|jgi:hypothetical protein
MKRIFNIVILLILFFITGCNDVSVVNPELSYKDYIVVRAELIAGEDFAGVKFTRTQPLNQQYDNTNDAITSNVTAYLKIGKVQVVPLYHAGNGMYKASDRIQIHSDSTYELFANVNGVGVYSITTVPEKPRTASANIIDKSSFRANIYTKPGAVYGAAWKIYNSVTNDVIDSAPDFKEVVQNADPFSTSTIPVNTMDLPAEYRTNNYSYLWYIRVYAYDSPYLKFFKTRNNSQPVSDVFSQGGDQIIWNVYGNNVIGLFIGAAYGDYVKVQ